MSEPYWEPLAAVPSTVMPSPAGQDGKWVKAAGGAAVWSTIALEDIPAKGAAGGIAMLDGSYHIPDVNLPDRIDRAALTITDWNSALANGWYMGNNVLNSPYPNPTGWSIGIVTSHDDNAWVTQDVWDFTAGVNSPKFQRRKLNGTWSGWESPMMVVSQATYNAIAHTPTTVYVIVG